VPERPQFSLLGTIVGGADSVALFVDETTKQTFRLRSGEGYAGWVLRDVRGREAAVEKNGRSETLALPAPSQQTGAPATIQASVPDPGVSRRPDSWLGSQQTGVANKASPPVRPARPPPPAAVTPAPAAVPGRDPWL
jgi:hypothetical protein